MTKDFLSTLSFTAIADESDYDSDDGIMGTPNSVFSAVSDASSQTSVASDFDEWVDECEKSSVYSDYEQDQLASRPARGLPSTTANAHFGPAGNFFHTELSSANEEADTGDNDSDIVEEAPLYANVSEQGTSVSDDCDLEMVDDELPDWRLSCELRSFPLTASIGAAPESSKISMSSLTPFLARDTSGLLIPSAARIPETKLAVHCGPGTVERTTAAADNEHSDYLSEQDLGHIGMDVMSDAIESPAAPFLGTQDKNSGQYEDDCNSSVCPSSTLLSDSVFDDFDASSKTSVAHSKERIIARALQAISNKSHSLIAERPAGGLDDVAYLDLSQIKSRSQLRVCSNGNSRLSSIWRRLRPKQMHSSLKRNISRGSSVTMGLLLPKDD